MNFWKQFVEILTNHPERILTSLFWLLQGKRKRARNRLGLLETHCNQRYRKWQQIFEKDAVALNPSDREQEEISFLVSISEYNSQNNIEHTIESLNAQSYTNWTLHTDEINPFNDKLSRFDFLIWLRRGDSLPVQALKNLVMAIQKEPDVDIFYSDHDYLLANGRREFPYFKGAWNFGLLLSSDYIFGLCAIRTRLLTPFVSEFNVLSWVGRYQALVTLGWNEKLKCVHISKVLYHCHKHKVGHPEVELIRVPQNGQESYYKILGQEIQQTGNSNKLALINIAFPAKEPKVSIIIPTKDGLDVLIPCVESVLKKTSYSNFEIIIVNNNSSEPETLAYLENVALNNKVRIIEYSDKFNYAAINNYGVEQADGEYVCLLNNDTEVIEPMWLRYMVAWATKQHVGAVGAKLLYADRRVQHAGVIIGLGGLAGHGHRFLKNSIPGYFYRAHLPQYVSAVTAACLLVAKQKYLEIGGMDGDNFAVAFNDVDFCLKLDAAGYDNVYEPRAVLYHYESQTRGKDISGEKQKRYQRECEMLQKRWSTGSVVDRYYSPHLADDREDFAIKTNFE